MVRFIFATGVLCSVSVVADVGTIDINGTRVTYDYLPFGEWSKQQTELIGGGHAQVVGSEYSNYRAKLAKGAYCAKITADRYNCRENVLTINAAGVSQCTKALSYTTTAQIGADGKLVNGNVAITHTFDNKDDCYRVTDAYKDAALAGCDATLANLKAQTAKQGFCL